MTKKTSTPRPGLDVAVVGISGRFPGAENVFEFWENLKNGVDGVSFWENKELEEAGIDRELLNNPNYVKANAVLDGIEYFDASFFDYTPIEAKVLDPQIRLFHECAWEALEDAGYIPDSYDGLIGVYAGAKSNPYWGALSILSGITETLGYFATTQLSNKDSLSTLTSYKLNLRGPSFNVQTACSTSLVAIHLASQGLLSGECDMALAGGANINLPQKTGYLFQEGMLYSSDGHCRVFDADADGSIFGSGAGIVVLKRIEDAIADRDQIYAVIKGSAVNNDGDRKPGFTAPSVDGQRDAVKAAQQMAEAAPESISYVETHGTATTLGDPVEFEALKQAFNTEKKAFCGIGSVKSNIGHLDSAAGVAGFIKTVLALKNRLIPPNLFFDRPNPQIDIIDSPFYINTQLVEWKDQSPLRAGVSTFGVGGTNVHVVLEEAPEIEDSDKQREWKLICISAKTKSALERTASNLALFLKNNPESKLADVAYTIHVGRKPFEHRQMLLSKENEGVIEGLPDAGNTHACKLKGKEPSVIFLFSGQKSIPVNRSLELYNDEPFFRKTMDECFNCFRSINKNFRDVIYTSDDKKYDKALYKEEISRPFEFMIEYSLAKLFMYWGVKPNALIGNTLGELVAACLAGIFSLDDALKLVHLSASIETTLDEMEMAFKKIKLNNPSIPFMSNLTGDWISEQNALSPNYWIKQLKNTKDGTIETKRLQQKEKVIYMDFGLNPDLAKRIDEYSNQGSEPYYIKLFEGSQDDAVETKQVISGIGHLWLNGVEINWNRFYEGEERFRISLPTYPFDRERFWIDDAGPVNIENAARVLTGSTTIEKNGLETCFYLPSWNRKHLVHDLNRDNEEEKSLLLIFADEHGLGDQIAKILRRQGNKVIVVKQGKTFRKNGKNKYEVNPQKGEDYIKLFDQIKLSKGTLGNIVHLWSIDDNELDIWETKSFKRSQDLGLFSLLYLVKAIDQKYSNHDFRLNIVSNGVWDLTGNDHVSPGKSTLLAASKVIPQEHGGIRCSTIDIDISETRSATEKWLANQLVREFTMKTSDTVVCYRGNYRWVEVFEPLAISESLENEQLVKDEGVYFITGGLGALGMILAEHLSEEAKAKLILSTRVNFPEKGKWKKWLTTHDDDDSVSVKIKKLQQIEKLGGEVLVVTADVTNQKQMKRAIKAANEHFGQINGVIHAAGVVDGKTFNALKELGVSDFEEQFQSKVYGIAVLEKVFKNVELDFCLLMSSMASVLGGLGHAPYAAANAFMDAYVLYRKGLGSARWLSVNWETIHTSRELKNDLPALGINELFVTPEEMLIRFRQLLSWFGANPGVNRIVFAKGNLEKRLDQWIRFSSVTNQDHTIGTDSTSTHSRPELLEPYEPAGNTTQQAMVQIWQEFFGFDKIGIHDNFFDLGGDSLKSIMIIGKIHKSLSVKIAIADFFKDPTIEGLSNQMDITEENVLAPIEKAEEKSHYPLSPGQESMYLTDRIHKGTDNNGLFVNIVVGKLNKERFENVFEDLIKRHEILRTSFELVQDIPHQKINDDAKLEIEYHESDDDGISKLINDFVRPFDLHKAPLLRVGIVKIKGKSLLLVDMHHLIADPVSEEILVREFLELYQGGELPRLANQYRDFVMWQQKLIISGELQKQKEYWVSELKKEIPILKLPLSHDRPDFLSSEGDTFIIEINKRDTEELQKLAKDEGVTLFMLLLAAYTVLLSKLSDQEDIIVGSPVTGRRHADFQQVIGMFLNMLPLRNYPKKIKSFKEFLQDVKSRTLKSLENQDYQLEYLIEQVVESRDLSRTPIFDTTFTLLHPSELDQIEIDKEDTKLKLTPFEYVGEKLAKFDLSLQIEILHDKRLRCSFFYRTSLFKKEMIQDFAKYFNEIVSSVIAKPDIKLHEINIIDELLIPKSNILLEEEGDFGF